MNEDFAFVDSPLKNRASAGPTGATWGWKALVIVTIIFSLLPLTSFLFPGSDDEELTSETLIISAVLSVFWYSGMAAIVYFAATRSGGNWANLGFRRPAFQPGNVFDSVRNFFARTLGLRLPTMAFVPFVGYAISYILVVIYTIIATAVGVDSLLPDEQVPDEAFNDKIVIALLGVSILFAAPIVEEIFFRGFLFGGLRRWVSFPVAALASGFLFSLSHGDVGLIIPFTLVGFMLAYAYERTGTLFGSISVHFLFNLVSFVAMVAINA